MKKLFFIVALIIFVSYIQVSQADTYKQIEMTQEEMQQAAKKMREPYNQATKDLLDSLAQDIVNAIENENYDLADTYEKKMLTNGAMGVHSYSKMHSDTCTYTITLNGQKYSGHTCIKVSYGYKGQTYDHGYCR